ncbi:MAG: hypothetical protein KDA46_11715 [Parvularculaceae bacterium]|nr:hypothetical protein [Parvularculaceae bacterium]
MNGAVGRVLVLLAVAAALLRAAAPAGYMVEAGPDGGLAVTLCGDGPGRVIAFDPATGPATGPSIGDVSTTEERAPHQPGDTQRQAPCAFAAAAHAFAPPALPVVLSRHTPRMERASKRAAFSIPLAPRLRASSPRGPPAPR